uniref:G_PROTEIN_RECEP_F1_2 domain-containing protein n=1 Tax=Panagrellus redivivus TaxID=6233 RepID=A0A7E4V3W4_PANRE
MPPLFGILVFIDEALASIFSYICNICLLYCVLKNYKPELKRLNMILIQNITLDLILGMFPIISGMWMAFVDGKVYVLMTGLVKYTSYNFACYSYCMYCAVLCLCVFAFPMQFYFRYKTLCREDKVPTYLHIGLWVILLTLATIIFWGFWIAYSFQHDLSTFNPKAAEVLSFYVGFDEDTPFVVAETSSFAFPGTFGFILITYIISCGIVCYYALCISQFVHRNAAMTANFKHLYMMLHRTLMTQAALFFIAAVIPVTTMSIFSVFRIPNAYYLFALASSAFAWVSAINPCVSIYLIRPYRRFLIRTIKKNCFPNINLSNISSIAVMTVNTKTTTAVGPTSILKQSSK